MKLLICGLLLSSTLAVADDPQFSISSSIDNSHLHHDLNSESINISFENELNYAQIYADNLIIEFDKLLDQKIALNDDRSILETFTYAKLMSARNFIENREHSNKMKHRHLTSGNQLFVNDLDLYNEVIEKINDDAQIFFEASALKAKMQKVEPSIYRSGNLRGRYLPKGVWALTYDDGPKPITTKKIVDDLYEKNLKATFFMLTRNAKSFKADAAYVQDSGMEIALHSYTHKSLKRASDKLLEKEITVAKKDLENIMGVDISLFRLPYGAGMNVRKVREKIAQDKMIHVFWDVDTLDWKDKNPRSIYKRALKQMKLLKNNAGIILFHDIQTQTVKASKLLTDYFVKKHLQTCSVGDLVKLRNGLESDCVLKQGL